MTKLFEQFMNRKWLLLGVVAIASLLILGHFDVALAAEDTDITKEATQLVSMGIKAVNVFLWPFLLIIGDLMDSDLIVGPGMESRLLMIWVQVRNLVNIGFVLVLLIIAFYNVLGIGGGEGNLALKTALPKLVLGLVLVNFTFIGGKVILDVTNVATTAAFALPEVVDDFDFSEERDDFAHKVCYKKYVADGSTDNEYWDEGDARIYVKPFCELGTEDSESTDSTGTPYKKYTGQLNEFAEVTYFQELNANNVGLVMAVNMGALESLELLDSDKVESFSDLAIASIFALVMYCVFAISYLVLGILLLTRVIVLWIALALSPVAVLFYVVPQLKEWMGGGGDLSSKVIKHLLSPIIVGLTMTLGYLMISAWDGVARGSGTEASIKFNELMSEEFLTSGIDDLPKFMIAIASVVIVWVGVFAAAEGTIAQTVTDGIKNFGTKIGGALAKAPLTIPTIPIFTKGDDGQEKRTPMSILGVSNLFDQGLHYMEYGRVQNEMQKLAENSNSSLLKEIIGGGGSSSNMSPQQNAERVKGALNKARDNQNYLSNSDLRNIASDLMNMVKHSGLGEKEQEDLNSILKKVEQGDLQAFKNLGSNSNMRQVLRASKADEDLLSTESLQDFHQTAPKASSSTSKGAAAAGAATTTTETVMSKNETDVKGKVEKVTDTGMKTALESIQTQLVAAEADFDSAGDDADKKKAAQDKITTIEGTLTSFDDQSNSEAKAAKKELQRVLNELKAKADIS